MFKVSTATSASLPDIGPKLDPISRTFQEFALNAGPTQCLAVQSGAKKHNLQLHRTKWSQGLSRPKPLTQKNCCYFFQPSPSLKNRRGVRSSSGVAAFRKRSRTTTARPARKTSERHDHNQAWRDLHKTFFAFSICCNQVYRVDNKSHSLLKPWNWTSDLNIIDNAGGICLNCAQRIITEPSM